jgi:hypothetical protein
MIAVIYITGIPGTLIQQKVITGHHGIPGVRGNITLRSCDHRLKRQTTFLEIEKMFAGRSTDNDI